MRIKILTKAGHVISGTTEMTRGNVQSALLDSELGEPTLLTWSDGDYDWDIKASAVEAASTW